MPWRIYEAIYRPRDNWQKEQSKGFGKSGSFRVSRQNFIYNLRSGWNSRHSLCLIFQQNTPFFYCYNIRLSTATLFIRWENKNQTRTGHPDTDQNKDGKLKMRVTGNLLSQCTFTASGGFRPSNNRGVGGGGGGGGGHPDPEIRGAWS